MNKCSVCGANLFVNQDTGTYTCINCNAEFNVTYNGLERISVSAKAQEYLENKGKFRIRMMNGQTHDVETDVAFKEYFEQALQKKVLHLVKENKLLMVDNIEAIWQL